MLESKMQPGTVRRHLARQLLACLGDPVRRRILSMVILMTGAGLLWIAGAPGPDLQR